MHPKTAKHLSSQEYTSLREFSFVWIFVSYNPSMRHHKSLPANSAGKLSTGYSRGFSLVKCTPQRNTMCRAKGHYKDITCLVALLSHSETRCLPWVLVRFSRKPQATLQIFALSWVLPSICDLSSDMSAVTPPCSSMLLRPISEDRENR